MQTKKKFVAVIGYDKSGKSTIISSLTGCRKSTFSGFIKDKVNNNSVFAYSGSPQELPITLSDIKKMLQKCNSKAGCSGMVMAIQPTKPRKRPSMEAIFKEAISQGFDVYAFAIEPGYDNQNKGCYVGVVERLKTLEVLSTKVFQIDGKKFVLHNAKYINSKVSIMT
jgi:energy-coupling factor transporter ATP-binding protein EcfA2